MNHLRHHQQLRQGISTTLAILLFTVALCGQDVQPAAEITPFVFSNTAYTLPARYGGFSLMHTSRYAVSRRVELGFHPILIFLSPGVEVKWKQMESERYTLSTFHSAKYVSPLLRTVQMEGAGGLISREFDMPDMVAFQNGVMASCMPGDQHYLTGKALFVFSINSATPDKNSTIDLPVIYPRSAVYYKNYGFITGLSMEGKLFGNFSYLGTLDAYFFPRGGLQFFNENQFGLIWRTGKKFMLMGGGELTYGEYPYGPQWHLFPTLDFRWFFRI